MPVIFSKHFNNHAHAALWKIEETPLELGRELELSEADQLRFANIKTEKHRIQWLASRVLLYQVFPEANIFYASSGKPLLLNGPHLSISHTEGYAAIVINENNSTGIDVQHFNAKLNLISKKFVNEAEAEIINNSTNRNIALHIIWNIKECLFKMHGSNLAFKDQIKVNPFTLQDEVIYARVSRNGRESLHVLEVKILADATLAFVIE